MTRSRCCPYFSVMRMTSRGRLAAQLEALDEAFGLEQLCHALFSSATPARRRARGTRCSRCGFARACPRRDRLSLPYRSLVYLYQDALVTPGICPRAPARGSRSGTSRTCADSRAGVRSAAAVVLPHLEFRLALAFQSLPSVPCRFAMRVMPQLPSLRSGMPISARNASASSSLCAARHDDDVHAADACQLCRS